MKPSRISAALALGGVALLGLGLPAMGQDSPESLLPPGFGDPAGPAPAPRPAPSRRPDAPSQGGTLVQPLPAPGARGPVAVRPRPAGTPTGAPGGGDVGQVDPAELLRYELPDYAKRSTARVGIAGAGLAPNAFGRADGRMLEVLMRRMDAPIASRWLSIVLRRALMSAVDTPRGLNGADFAAERAWLLIRMGEANGARALVQAVDVENYTPKLFQVAMQAQLASADPAGLCPLVDHARQVSRDRGWVLADAMCTALAGEPDGATAKVDAARRTGVARGADMALVEKVVGRGAGGKRDATVEWDSVKQINAWRWGLATATGQDIPAALMAKARPQVWLWSALAPTRAPAERIDAAERAAAQGVLSAAAYLDLYGAIEEDGEGAAAVSLARDLRTASIAPSAKDRMDTLRTLWKEPAGPRARYARLVLTARAAAMIDPSSDFADDSVNLIAAMLTTGNDERAMAWRSVVARGSDGWAMLALANPRPAAPVGYAEVDAYRGAASDAHKAQLLFAGLAGLGRLDAADIDRLAQGLGVPIRTQDAWTRAIDAAARRGEPGTVVLLSAVGMQTPDWRGVPAVSIYHITRALKAVGMEAEARMIAAEAIARL